VAAPLVDAQVLKDRHKAFEVFRETYHKKEAIESNKTVLKAKYDEAKVLSLNPQVYLKG
jgi:kinesin family protein 6/9